MNQKRSCGRHADVDAVASQALQRDLDVNDVPVAVDLGLDYDDALTLVLETARGAGEMAEQSGETMDSLIARVRSRGGTTAAAFDYLDGTDFRDIFMAAVVAARDRAVHLADQAHESGKEK